MEMRPALTLGIALLVGASCRAAGVTEVGDATAPVDPSGGPLDGGPASTTPDAGPTEPALSPTACGPARSDSTPVVLLDRNFWGYHGVGTDGAQVYYPASADGQLLRVPLDGGRPAAFTDQPYLRNVKSRVCVRSRMPLRP